MSSVVSREEAKAIYRHVSCGKLIHTWAPHSCTEGALTFARNIFTAALPMYASLFTAGAVLRRQSVLNFLRETCPNIVWSTLFLTSYAGSLVAFVCLLRTLAGNRNYILLNGFVPAFLASWSMLLERKSRRAELAVYIATQGLWSTWRKARHHRIVADVPGGDVLLFASSLAVLLRSLDTAPPSHNKGIVAKILRTLVPAESSCLVPLQPEHVEPLQHQGRGGNASSRNSRARTMAKALRTLVQWSGAAKALRGLARKGACVGPSPLCRHQDNCVYRAVSQGIRGACIGWAVKTVLEALRQRRSMRGVLLAPFRKKHVAFALTLGGIPGVFNAVRCLMRRLGSSSSSANDLVAGFMAGLPFYLSRSTGVAVYLVGKAIEALFWEGVDRRVLAPIPHGDILLYALGVGVIMHCGVIEPIHLPPSYWNFAERMSKGLFSAVDRSFYEDMGIVSLPDWARKPRVA